MMIMRRFGLMACLAVVACVMLVGGCGQGGTDGGPVVLKLGYVMAPQGAAHEGAVRFAELVAQKTEGRVKVELKHSAQLGTDRQLTEGLLLGTVDVVLSGFASISGFIPEYEPLESPFAFRDYGHMERVLAGEVGQEAEATLRERKGIEILAWWPRGPRYVTANKAIRKPEDLKGLKLRVPELPHYIEAWKVLGANTTPITYNEMFLALKQGVVDGQENPLENIYTAGLYDVQSHVVETRHLIGCYQLMVGKPTLGKLSETDRKILKEAAVEAGVTAKRRMEEMESEYTVMLKEKGMTFVAVDDMEAFAGPVIKRLPEAFADRWKPGLYERIREMP